MLLLSSIILAATISTTDNREFFPNLTSRWPSAVSEYATPGSAAFLTNNLSITVTNAAALYAIFNAYYERIYYFNQGSYVSSELTPDNFDFVAHSGGEGYIADLDRLSTPDDSLTALTKMSTLGNVFVIPRHFSAEAFRVYVNEWGRPSYQWVSSSRIKKLDSGAWVDLDTDLPSFNWRRLVVGSEGGPTQYMRSLDDFNPDMIFRKTSRNAASYYMWLDIYHGDALNRDIESQCKPSTNETTFSEAVQHYFTGDTNGFFNVRNPTNVLQRTQDWMSSMGRALSLIDRCYTSYPIPNAISGETTSYESSIGATYSNSVSGTITIANDGNATFTTPITIGRGDWTVGTIETNSSTMAATNGWDHAYELRMGEVSFSRSIDGTMSSPVFEYDIDLQSALIPIYQKMETTGKTIEIYAVGHNNTVTLYGFYTNAPSAVTELFGYTIDGGTYNLYGTLEAIQGVARQYGMTESVPDYGPSGYGMNFRVGAKSSEITLPCVGFLSSLVNDRNSDWVGGQLPSGASDYPFAQLRYSAVTGGGAGEGVTNFVRYCKAEMQRHVRASAKERWGDWADPSGYATVTAYEASYPAVASNANVAATGYATHDADAYLLEFGNDDVITKLIARKGTNYTVIASEPSTSEYLYHVSHDVTPLFDYAKDGYEENRAAHRSVADGYITQRITYDFDSLKLSDE